MSNWYYKKDDRPIGPVSVQELRKLIARGEIRSHTLVCDSTAGAWFPAHMLKEYYPPRRCSVCGEDCLRSLPLKDKKGNYYCQSCFAVRQASKPPTGSDTHAPTVDARSSQPDSPLGEDAGLIPFLATYTDEPSAYIPTSASQEVSQPTPPVPSQTGNNWGIAPANSDNVVWELNKSERDRSSADEIRFDEHGDPEAHRDLLAVRLDRVFGCMAIVAGVSLFVLTLLGLPVLDFAYQRGPFSFLLMRSLLFGVAAYGGMVWGGALIVFQEKQGAQRVLMSAFAAWVLLTLFDLLLLLVSPHGGFSIAAARHRSLLGFVSVKTLIGSLFIALLTYEWFYQSSSTKLKIVFCSLPFLFVILTCRCLS